MISGEKRGMSGDLHTYVDYLLVRYNCAMFHDCRICVTDLREGDLFTLLYPSAAPKRPINMFKISHLTLYF